MAFDFKRHLIKVQGGRTYLPVSARIVWFREQHPDWAVVTEIVEINHEKQFAIFRATIFNSEGKIMATGTKKEDVKGFGDYVEKAETGSVGRALALCGFGTQFSPELDDTSTGNNRPAQNGPPMGGRYDGNNNNRYGSNNGENRFAPPREVSAPVPARPSSPPPPTPPSPVKPVDEGEDDFESLVGADALPHASEEDPFGDSDIQASMSKAEARPDGPPACGTCGKALTKAQQDLSIRNYGEALCPTCQRDKPRAGRTAVAER
jgi:hypothetical protein